MAENRVSRGLPLPSVWQIVVIAAALVAAWLVWSQYGRIGDNAEDGRLVDSPVKGFQAVEAYAKLGALAVPELLAQLDSTDAKERSQAAYGLGRIGPTADEALEKLLERLADDNPQVRTNAAFAVAHIVLDRMAAAAAIAPLLADAHESVREDVGKQLVEIGSPALVPILDILHSEEAAVRLNVVRLLRSTHDMANFRGWGSQHAEISQAIHGVLNDADPAVRVEALTILADWDQATPAEVGELLRNAEEQRVLIAVKAVAQLKEEAAELLPDIVILIDKFDGRVDVLGALTSMKTAARPAVPRLLQLAENCKDSSRMPIAQTLADTGADPDDIVRILSPLLLDEDRAWRAGELLMKVSPEGARRQVSLLIPKLVGHDGTVDKSVLFALHSLGHEAQEAVPALIPLLKNPDPWVAEFAAHALSRTGLAGVKGAPDLASVISNGSRPIVQRLACANALASLGAGAQSTVPALLQVIAQAEPISLLPSREVTESHVRAAIIQALGRIGGDDAKLVPALRSQLTSRSPDVRAAAAEALGRVAGHSAEVLADLVRRLRDDFPMVRAQAALAIGRATVDRNKAVAPLIIALADENPSVRLAAAVALGKIGSAAREALPALREILARAKGSRGNAGSEQMNIPELNSLPVEKAARTAIKAIAGESEKDAP